MMFYAVQSSRPGKNGLKPLILSVDTSVLTPTSPDLEAQQPSLPAKQKFSGFRKFINAKILRKEVSDVQPECQERISQQEKRTSTGLKELRLPAIVKRKSSDGSYSDFSPPPSPLRNQVRPVSLWSEADDAEFVDSKKDTRWGKVKAWFSSCLGTKNNLATLSAGDAV